MNKSPVLSAVLLMLSAVLFFTLMSSHGTSRSAPNAEMQTKAMSAKYAALQTLNAATDELSKEGPGTRLGDMRKTISEDVPSHRVRAKSEAITRSWAESRLKEDFQGGIQQVWQRFQLESLGISKQDFEREATQKVGGRFAGAADAALKEKFVALYESARAAVVKEQAGKFTLAAYPAQEEAEKIDLHGWESPNGVEILNKLRASVRQRIPVVFEENEAVVGRMVENVKSSIETQKAQQFERLVKIPLPEGPLSKDAAARVLQDALQSWLAGERMKSTSTQVYEIFPSARSKLDVTSSGIESERFVKYLASVKISVSEDSLRTRVRGNLAAYRDKAPSLQKIGKEMVAGAGTDAIAQYTAKPLQYTDMAAFRTRLTTLLKQGPAEEVLWASLVAQLGPVHDKVRDAVADEQLKVFFTPVHARVWTVQETELKVFVEGGSMVSEFNQCLKFRDIRSSTPYAPADLLTETERRVVGAIVNLIEEGKKAWSTQDSIVKSRAGAIRSEMLMAAEKKQLGNKEDWISKYTGEVKREWEERRVKILWPEVRVQPSNATTKYLPLFGEMILQIKQKVSEFYEEFSKLPPPAPLPPPVQKPLPMPTTKPSPLPRPEAVEQAFSSDGSSSKVPATPNRSGTADTSGGGGAAGASSAVGGSAGAGSGPAGGQMGSPVAAVSSGGQAAGNRFVDWLRRIPWEWLLLLLLLLTIVASAVGWWARGRSRQSQEVSRALTNVLGPYVMEIRGDTVRFRSSSTGETWVLARATVQ